MLKLVLTLSLGVLMSCPIAEVHAQGYPTRPIRVILPIQPGASLDLSVRRITPKLAEALGRPFIVEHHAGADTTIGISMVARAAPDGYTLLGVFDTFPISQHLIKNLPYDAIRDFAPISLMVRGPMIIAVPPQLGIKDLNQLLQLARSKGGGLNYGSAGAGSSSHLSTELFKLTTGIGAQRVHYKGAAPAVADLIGGHVQFMIAASGTFLPHIRSGRLMPLAVTAPKRIAQLPNVPAVAESFPGFEAQSWIGMLAPAGTQGEIIQRLGTEIVKALADPETKKWFEGLGFEVVGSSSEGFAKWIVEQSDKWGRVIREQKITVE